MIISQASRKLETNGVTESGGFKIAATGHMQQILSDGLYTNKILAVLREVTCNAMDAHTKAGKGDVPISVSLPTQLKPTLEIRDEGVGLSHSDVMELYTTYGHSDKGDSNEQIGGLGLGSKSPFAYSDQFNIESRYEGEVRKYICYKDDQSMMQIALMGEGPTDDCNGLTIQVPVKKEDIYTFETEALKLFKYYPVIPLLNIGADSLTLPVTRLSGKGWVIYDTKEWYPKAKAKMGAVLYPIEANSLPDGISKGAKELCNTNIHIDFDIGELSIAVNREGLQYTKSTTHILVDRLESICKDLTKEASATISKEHSMLKAFIKLHKIGKETGGSLGNLIVSNGEYRGKGVVSYYKEASLNCSSYYNDKLKASYPKASIKDSINATFRDKSSRSYSQGSSFSVSYLETAKFYLVDTPKAWQKRILKDVEDNDLTPVAVQGDNAKEYLDLLGTEYTLVSTLPEWVVQRAPSGTKQKVDHRPVTLKVLDIYGWNGYLDTGHTISDGGVYFKMFKGMAVEGDINVYSLVKEARKYDPNTQVYGIPGTHYKALERNKDKWVSLEDHVKSLRVKAKKDILSNKKEYLKYWKLELEKSLINNYLYRVLTHCNDKSILSKKPSFRALQETHKEYNTYRLKYGDTLEDFKDLCPNIKAPSYSLKIKEYNDEALKKQSMLVQIVRTYNSSLDEHSDEQLKALINL